MSESTNAILKRMSDGGSRGPLVILMTREYEDRSGTMWVKWIAHISEEDFISAVQNQVPFVLREPNSDGIRVTNYYPISAKVTFPAPSAPLCVDVYTLNCLNDVAGAVRNHLFEYRDDYDAWITEMKATS